MEFTGTNNSVGVFLRDVSASQLGDKADIFNFRGQARKNILGPKGLYLKIDENNPELTLWKRTPDEWKRSEVVTGKDGVQYGVPVIGTPTASATSPTRSAQLRSLKSFVS